MSAHRYPELDALRSIAVILMIIYHAAAISVILFGKDIAFRDGGWLILGRSAAITFLLLVGCCFMISWERTEKKKRLWKYTRRALIILMGALLITMVTQQVLPDAYVRFGILHLIGVSILLQAFLAPLKTWNLLTGAIAWFLVPKILPDNMLMLGTPPQDFMSIDYYPLFPWIGLTFVGMGIGSLLYLPKPLFIIADIFPQWFLWIGRTSLWIYFVHIPFLIAVLSLVY